MKSRPGTAAKNRLVKRPSLYFAVRIAIGGVWFVNGLVCKVLGWVPRHGEIVSKILGEEWARPLTIAIGLGEGCLAVWIWSGFRSRVSALLQISLVFTMNIIEFLRAQDMLLWGPLNSLYALAFVLLVAWHEFWLKPRRPRNS